MWWDFERKGKDKKIRNNINVSFFKFRKTILFKTKYDSKTTKLYAFVKNSF